MRFDRAARAASLVAIATAALPTVAPAQGINDDVRCLLVSNGLARVAKDPQARIAAAMTSAFYLGRLSGHQADAALVAAIRAQGSGVPAAQALTIMHGCSDRANAAKQQLGSALTQAQQPKK